MRSIQPRVRHGRCMGVNATLRSALYTTLEELSREMQAYADHADTDEQVSMHIDEYVRRLNKVIESCRSKA